MPINPLRGDKALRTEDNRNSGYDWNFFREGSNHAYLSNGAIFYEGICKNNLIISSRENNSLNDLKDSFIFSNGKKIEVFPISDFEKIKKRSLETIAEGEINYNTPLAVKRREKLFDHDLDRVKVILEKSYGINPSEINLISSGRTKLGKYFVRDVEGRGYVFKYKGIDKKGMESNSAIIFELDSYFPKIHKRIDKSSAYGINIGDGIYGLENFIVGNSNKKRDLDYIKKVGKTIAFLHNHLNNSKIFKLDVPKREEDFSESNLSSMYLDIVKDNPKSHPLIPFVQELIDIGFSNRMRQLPERLIHGDVNRSNVIERENDLLIIDSENFGFDKRLKEFVPPLLLKGDNSEPEYLKRSLPRIIRQYNKYSQEPLSEKEISILPLLLQAATLKYYVVRSIRRKYEKGEGIKRTIKNLEEIRRDANVY